MISVGLGGSIHDFAIIAADEHSIICGIEDERVTGVRHALNSNDPLRASWEHLRREIPSVHPRFTANDTLSEYSFVQQMAPELISHHLAHALSVFLTSKFEESVIIVIDGAGSITRDEVTRHWREATSVFYGQGDDVRLIHRSDGLKQCPSAQNDFSIITNNSIGDLYEWVTTRVGFQPLQEGKTMALAAYGDDRYTSTFLEHCLLDADGQVRINIDQEEGLSSLKHFQSSGFSTEFEERAALAYAAQATIERLVFSVAEHAFKLTGCRKLCIAGGVALNAVMIGKILENTPFDELHVISAPADNGTAVGAALYPFLTQRKVSRWEWLPFLGPRHRIDEAFFSGFSFTQFSTDELLIDSIVRCLKRGEIVGLYRGRSEFGPRALGHRSLLAFSGIDGIQNRINNLKNREWFRPVAPVTTVAVDKVMEGAERLMQSARPMSASHGWPRAALHVDGSARVQVVDRQNSDPFFFALANAVETRLGAPMLNTSLNLFGRPIVEFPEDAVELFRNSPLNSLVVDNFLVEKNNGL